VIVSAFNLTYSVRGSWSSFFLKLANPCWSEPLVCLYLINRSHIMTALSATVRLVFCLIILYTNATNHPLTVVRPSLKGVSAWSTKSACWYNAAGCLEKLKNMKYWNGTFSKSEFFPGILVSNFQCWRYPKTPTSSWSLFLQGTSTNKGCPRLSTKNHE
jgi:hypothetical protein